jgi:PAT family beta-lactamase induction signal transducer AmpG
LLIGSVAALLYFSEGLPFGIVNDLLPVYLRVHKVDLTTIGFLSTVASAWTLKVFWSPLIDAFGTYRRWIATAVLAMAICMCALAMMPEIEPGVGTNPQIAFWTIITIFAISSATQDLAVDAFTIRATPPEFVGPVNSIRVAAYRSALIVGGGGLVALSSVIGWRGSFAVSATIAVIVLVITLRLPEDGERVAAGPAAVQLAGRRRSGVLALFRGLGEWLRRPRAGVLLAIVLLYRLGELAIYTMIKPYWVDRGYSPAEIGTITAVIGVIISILGAIAGGAIVARIGLYRAMLWLGAAQILSNLGYALVATTHAGRWAIYAAAIVENIGYGLGTGAFLAFLMAICDRERAATEYAMLTAVFGLSRVLIGTPSGWIAQHAGYASYFWLTVFLGIPGLLLVPFARERIGGVGAVISDQ